MPEAGTIQTSEPTSSYMSIAGPLQPGSWGVEPDPSKGVSRGSYYKPVLSNASLPDESGIVNNYQMGAFDKGAYSDQGDFMTKLLSDTQGKYIGAVPKIGGVSKVGEMNQPASTPAAPTESKSLNVASDAASAASGVADRLFTATQNVTQNQRQADLIKWKEDGKYWFDPNSDLKPDLDTYLSQMPSATDALVQGSPIAKLGLNKNAAGNTASSVLINPAGFKVKNQAVSNILNPTNLADKKMGEGFANYVGSKAAQGAMSSGLGPQMIVGGIVGMFEGIFGWTAAKDEDARNKKAATEEYNKALRDWTVNRNKRLIAEKQEKYAEQQAALDRSETLQKTKGAEKALNIAARRKQIAEVLANAGSISKSNRDQRLARWR